MREGPGDEEALGLPPIVGRGGPRAADGRGGEESPGPPSPCR